MSAGHINAGKLMSTNSTLKSEAPVENKSPVMSDIMACKAAPDNSLPSSLDMAGPTCKSLIESTELPKLMSDEACEVDSSAYAADTLYL